MNPSNHSYFSLTQHRQTPKVKRWHGNLLREPTKKAFDAPRSHLDVTYYRLMNPQSFSYIEPVL